ncbi:hypothetical protein BDW62DRAFT_177051 [Aspergillus aurantiobrunneus]
MPSEPQQKPTPQILLLKTKSSPHDGYDEFFSPSFKPTFVPVLSHNFHCQNLSLIKALFENGSLHPGPRRRYGGLIFTSQRAVEAFADMVRGVEGESISHAYLPLSPCLSSLSPTLTYA